MATSATNPSGSGNSGNSGNSGQNNNGGTGGDQNPNGAGAQNNSPNAAGGDAGINNNPGDGPPSWFSSWATKQEAALTNLKKEFNKDLNGVKGSLEKQLKSVSNSGGGAGSGNSGTPGQSQSEDELLRQLEDDARANTNTSANSSSGSGTGSGSGSGSGQLTTPPAAAINNNNPADPRIRLLAAKLQRQETEKAELADRVRAMEEERKQEKAESIRLKVANRVSDIVGKRQWASSTIQDMFRDGILGKAMLDENNDVIVDGMPVSDYVEMRWTADRSLQPIPVNASGSGNQGGSAAFSNVDWSKFNPNAKGVTPAQRDGYRQYMQSLARQARG